uniref:NAD-dependent protein deacetylase n=1 Tax=Trichobilharzia regenti TaxID=157069 RepID=A0AA85J675_TRIRE|nr:unnamed protein product [Trichobilharzia regenti]
MSFIFDGIKKALGLDNNDSVILDSLDIEGVSKIILNGEANKIVTMVGAGISTAAGIPDFRSPSSGLYDNLQEFNLSNPMEIFSIDYFRHDPGPFFEIARRVYKPEAKPTLAHYFIRLLHEKGLLLRHYTQNVDNLERLSGLPEEKLVEAHGTFNTGHCIKCKEQYGFHFMLDEIMAKKTPKCLKCEGVVKPDVVFFGENMPKVFYKNLSSDFSECDLLIIMGTSLTVLPFCALIHRVGTNVPRLYINREFSDGSTASSGESNNKRDVFWSGNTDDGAIKLSELLGWKNDLLKLKEENDARITAELGARKSQKCAALS